MSLGRDAYPDLQSCLLQASPSMKSVPVAYLPGERVILDDSEIIGRVNEVAVADGRICYRVVWMHNGCQHMEYFDAFMLKAVER